MIPNRIEAFCDLSGFTYLREFTGQIARGVRFESIPDGSGNVSLIVVAEEIEGESQKVVRTWGVILESIRDGSGLRCKCSVPHRIVSRDIRPGEPTPDYDPNSPPPVGKFVGDEELRHIRRARDEMLADRERHQIHAQTYLDALKRADDWRGNVQHLNKVVADKDLTIAKRDDRIAALESEAESYRLQIATLQASYAALEHRKSLWGRLKVWFQSTLTKWSFGRPD